MCLRISRKLGISLLVDFDNITSSVSGITTTFNGSVMHCWHDEFPWGDLEATVVDASGGFLIGSSFDGSLRSC